MPRNRLPPWHEEFVLPNRRAILIRPIRPEDASPLQGVFGMLGPAELRAFAERGAAGKNDGTRKRSGTLKRCRTTPRMTKPGTTSPGGFSTRQLVSTCWWSKPRQGRPMARAARGR